MPFIPVSAAYSGVGAGQLLVNDINNHLLALRAQQHVVKPTNQVGSGITVITDNTLLFAVAANEVWEVDLLLQMSHSGTTDNFLISWSGPTGATWILTKIGTETVSTTSLTSATTNPTVYGAKSVISVGSTAGTMNLTWSSAVSSSSNFTLLANSRLAAILLIP